MKNVESPKRASEAAAIALAAIIGTTGAGAANEFEQDKDTNLSPSQTEQYFPQDNPFWGIDQAIEVNPIDLNEYEEEIQRYKDGEISIGELPIGVARTINPEKAMEYISENQTGDYNQNEAENINTFKESTLSFMNNVFNKDEEGKRVSSKYLGNSLNGFYEFHGEDIARIDIAGIELYTKDDLSEILKAMNYGDSYSQELANEDRENAEKIIDSSRLTTTSALYMDLLLTHDVTKNPELRKSIEEEAKVLASWAVDNIGSFSAEEIEERMNGYALYMARNYRDKGAYPPFEN